MEVDHQCEIPSLEQTEKQDDEYHRSLIDKIIINWSKIVTLQLSVK